MNDNRRDLTSPPLARQMAPQNWARRQPLLSLNQGPLDVCEKKRKEIGVLLLLFLDRKVQTAKSTRMQTFGCNLAIIAQSAEVQY